MPKRVNYESHAHFRVPSDFMDRVFNAAERKGITAANFMRMAILEAIAREDKPYEVNSTTSQS